MQVVVWLGKEPGSGTRLRPATSSPLLWVACQLERPLSLRRPRGSTQSKVEMFTRRRKAFAAAVEAGGAPVADLSATDKGVLVRDHQVPSATPAGTPQLQMREARHGAGPSEDDLVNRSAEGDDLDDSIKRGLGDQLH